MDFIQLHPDTELYIFLLQITHYCFFTYNMLSGKHRSRFDYIPDIHIESSLDSALVIAQKAIYYDFHYSIFHNIDHFMDSQCRTS